MTTQTELTERDIMALASDASFTRGMKYYRDELVSHVVRRGNFVTARVAGSGYEPYDVAITLDESGIADSSCTCPYDWGGICKHIVAVLLTLINDKKEVVEKPALETLLANLTADDLRRVLLGAAAQGVGILAAIEQEIGWLKAMPASATPITSASIDLNAIHREIRADFRQSSARDARYDGYYDEYDGLEMNPDLILDPYLTKVRALLDVEDVAAAAAMITTIVDAYINEVTNLDEHIYDYNIDIFDEATLMLGEALAEVLLSHDLSPAEIKAWSKKVAAWEEDLLLEIATTALEQGWTYPPLVAAMQGHITERGAWEGEAPDFANELAQARLRILARQGRTAAYINLAEAEGETQMAILMRLQVGDYATAVADAKAYLALPRDAHAVATVLVEKGKIAEALEVAAQGLALEAREGKVELARWTRDQATATRQRDLALQAAQAAFTASLTFDDYTATQAIAGDEWSAIRPAMLQAVRGGWDTTSKVDVYLHENMLREAMELFDKVNYGSDQALMRVVDAVSATYPDWCIRQYQKRGEVIMDAGKAQAYYNAAIWLRRARDIYQQHNRLPEWQQYLNHILSKHGRKYKLVPLLRDLR